MRCYPPDCLTTLTIKSAVASFDIGDVRVNLIDTPGHPDFIAEVERVLGVLDGRFRRVRPRGRAAADPHPDAGARRRLSGFLAGWKSN